MISLENNIVRNMRIINNITQENMANYLHYTRIEYNRKERQNKYNLYIYLKLSILYNVNIGHTAPMCIFPMGQKIKLDLDNKEIVFFRISLSRFRELISFFKSSMT